jgi:hypothetical protein
LNKTSASHESASPTPIFGQIPEWTVSGVLPPYLGAPTSAIHMAPYPTALPLVVERFAFSPKRIEILQGLLSYRQELAQLGIVDGFQWLTGSILENIENLESRDPNDIDIVTFFRRPIGAKDPIAWMHFGNINRQSFSPQRNKMIFKCDTQYIDLDASSEDVANLTRFWFGLFSHRRNDQWKGMLTIPLLTSTDDAIAQEMLALKCSQASNSTGGDAP